MIKSRFAVFEASKLEISSLMFDVAHLTVLETGAGVQAETGLYAFVQTGMTGKALP